MSDAKNLSENIHSSTFDHRSLIKITKNYHHSVCDDGQCIVYYKKERKLNDAKWKITYGLHLGYSFSSLKTNAEINLSKNQKTINNITYYQYSNIQSNINTSSTGNSLIPGVFININRNGRLSGVFEFNYNQIKYSGYEFQSIQTPISLNIDLVRHKKVTPYIKFGIGFNFFLDTKVSDNLYVSYNKLINIWDFVDDPIYETETINLTPNDIYNNSYSTFNILGIGTRFNLKSQDAAIKIELASINSTSRSKPNSEASIDLENNLTHKDIIFSLYYVF